MHKNNLYRCACRLNTYCYYIGIYARERIINYHIHRETHSSRSVYEYLCNVYVKYLFRLNIVKSQSNPQQRNNKILSMCTQVT